MKKSINQSKEVIHTVIIINSNLNNTSYNTLLCLTSVYSVFIFAQVFILYFILIFIVIRRDFFYVNTYDLVGTLNVSNSVCRH